MLGRTLIASVGAGSVVAHLTGIDIATGQLSWRLPGCFAGQGQPTTAGDGITLAGRHVLAVSGTSKIAAVDSGGRFAWSATGSTFSRTIAGERIGWTADMGQVWLIGDHSEGRSLASGARLRHADPATAPAN